MYQGKYAASIKRKAKAVPAAAEAAQKPVQQPAPEPAAKPVKAKKKNQPKAKKRSTVGTVIFYLLYFLGIAAAVLGVRYGLGLLEDWLIKYEASQPDAKKQEIYEQLFADPDWAELYTMGGLEVNDTEYEDVDDFVAYMEQLVGDQELICSQTSAGLSGGQKYLIKLGDRKLASFTMRNEVTEQLEIPQWELSGVEVVMPQRTQTVTVHIQAGRTVSVNGIVLDDSHTVRTTSSMVENYLPEGVYGPRTATVYAESFLVDPEVVVTDEAGNPVQMDYDPATDTYTEVTDDSAAAQLSAAEEQILVDATKSYCKHMIGAKGAKLSEHFDTSTTLYKTITRNELWFKGYARYDFSEATVTEYARYTDDLFSARVQITLNTYRNDGSCKPFDVNTTFFMERNRNGNWLVVSMTNVDVHQQLTQVRLTYTVNDVTIFSGMVDGDATTLTPPAVEVPEGKVFVGWFRQERDENGDTKLSLAFTPDANGNVTLAAGYVLEPMELQALFEDTED